MRVSTLRFGAGQTETNRSFTGEGNFDDKQASGTATPTVDPADVRGGKRKKVAGGKKAKTTKQRLAIADGEME
jgi:chromatin-remodeling ATPase INO80